MDYKIEKIDKYSDVRGELIVFLRGSDLDISQKKFGQIYFVTFSKKGTIRANHYHKKIREWFGVVHGRVQVELKDIKTNKRKKLILDGKSNLYLRLEIGPNVAHAFKSLTSTASVINYTDKEWSSDDVFSHTVL